MKLSLGTVQFGMKYGISNCGGQTSRDEVKEILNKALESGIRDVDTAFSYGESEQVLGNSGYLDQFRVITKTRVFTELNNIVKSDQDKLEMAFRESLNRLCLSSVHGLMLHQITDLYKSGGGLLIERLQSLKKQGLVNKIGVSLYSSEDVDFLLRNFEIDLVQLPVNIFDQRLIIDGSLKKLKKAGVEIHVRSAFLQGLIFMKPEDLKGRVRFSKFLKLFQYYHSMLTEYDLKPAQLALSFLNKQEEIDKIVCGVNNKMQLKELCDLEDHEIGLDWVKNLSVSDEEVINPLKWLNDKL